MRLEQLVLYGAGVDDRLRFGSHVTVFAGLGAPDRIELIETIVDALTGRLSNASVVFTDRDGRRIFADRTGATFADTGLSAPGPAVLLGRDPSAVAGMLTLTAADLGLGLDQTVAHVTHQVESAREALAGYHTEHVQALELADALDRGRRHLAALDAQLATTEDDRARWRWQQNRNKLDELRAELAIARRSSGASAQKILASVDALRAAGSEWADLAASVTELQDRMRPLPQVSSEDLARVAATPDQPPTTFLARLDAWRAAQEAVRAAEAELTEVSRPHPRNTDPLVEAFARLDQTRLWAAHARLTQAAQAYHGVSAAAEEEFPEDTDAERAVELAHLEVVRAQHQVDQRVRPGAIAAAALVAASILAAVNGLWFLTVASLAGAAALIRWLVIDPRRVLAAAGALEAAALDRRGVTSWLGMHLRRLDDAANATERTRFEKVANNWVIAQVKWEEVAGALSADDLTAHADDVKARAASLDGRAVARRRDDARVQAESAAATERSARSSLSRGLEHFGFTPASVADLDPEQLASALDRRIEAGRVARSAVKLASLRGREDVAAQRLETLLGRLGFTDGALPARLDRAIQAVNSARQSQPDNRTVEERTELEAEIARLEVIVSRTSRPGWTDTEDLTVEPTDPAILERQRQELSALTGVNADPDLVAIENRYRVGLGQVRELEARLEGVGRQRPENLEARLTERCNRTAAMDGAEETMPLLIDDAFVSLDLPEKASVLDHLVRLSDLSQVVILSDDPVVTRWARSRSGHEPVTLFELETADVAVEPAFSHR